jgi:hypothetical protein
MAAIPALLLSALASISGQSAANGVASAPLAEAPSAADAAFEAELTELRRVQEALGRAKVEPGVVLAERMPRFIELAQLGSGRSAAFALVHYESEPGGLRRERHDKQVLYHVLERSFAGQEWLLEPDFDVFGALPRDASILGAPQARDLARTLRTGAESVALSARSLLAEALIELEAGTQEPSARRRARALLQELIDLHPDTEAAVEAGLLLWRLDHLSVGTVAPDFVAKDVDGNELRLSDWDRQVVLVDFWSQEDPGAEKRMASRRALFERFRDERFTLIGINLDGQESIYRRSVEEFEIDWPNVFTGGTNERVIWTIRGPANFVLGPGRVIRFTDLGVGELEQAIEQLLAEGKEVGDPEAKGSSPPMD